MTAREHLQELLDAMPEERLREVVRYAEFLNWQEEREDWNRFGRDQFAKAYGPDEPNYTEADLKPETSS